MRALELVIIGLVVLVAVEVLSERDPFECRAAGRRLTDEELARASLAFLRGEQTDNALTPRPLPEGFDRPDVEALIGDSRFAVDVAREGDGPGDVLAPQRFWLARQAFGARLAVSLTLPGDTPDAAPVRLLHVSDACGTVLVDWGDTSRGRTSDSHDAGTE